MLLTGVVALLAIVPAASAGEAVNRAGGSPSMMNRPVGSPSVNQTVGPTYQPRDRFRYFNQEVNRPAWDRRVNRAN
jgi:hypothetical protein